LGLDGLFDSISTLVLAFTPKDERGQEITPVGKLAKVVYVFFNVFFIFLSVLLYNISIEDWEKSVGEFIQIN